MKLSPLRLERYIIKESHFSLRSEYAKEIADPAAATRKSPPGFLVAVSAKRSEKDPLHWLFEITVELPDDPEKDFPYIFKVTAAGSFHISPEFPSERAEDMIRANAPALLYSSLREHVLMITGRSQFKPILLPSVTFATTKPGAKSETQPPKKMARRKSQKQS
jgi:preprotein translocase subunit SecB